jgi:hypothetical protein
LNSAASSVRLLVSWSDTGNALLSRPLMGLEWRALYARPL